MTRHLKLNCASQFTSCVVVAIMVLPLCCAGAFAAQSEEALLQQFRREAPAAWQKHHSLSLLIPGTWRRTNQYAARPGHPASTEVIDEEYTIASGAAVLVHRSRKDDREAGVPLVLAYNPRYAFELGKQSNAETDPWTLGNLSMDPENRVGKKIREIITPPNCLLTRIGNSTRLEDYVNDNDTEATLELVNGDLVTILFERKETSEPQKLKWPRKAKVTFNRARSWVITYSRFVGPTGTVSEASIECRLEGAIPILTRRVVRDYRSESATESVGEGIEEFALQYPPPAVPKERFTLTAFGLPEPPGETQVPSFPWFLLVGTTGVLFLAVGLWRLRRATVTKL